jgi:hypothetical protein
MEMAESDSSTESVVLRLDDESPVCDSALDFENAALIAASRAAYITPAGIVMYVAENEHAGCSSLTAP